MVTPGTRLSFSDCYELMDKALGDQKGIRIKFASDEDAWHFRLRLHSARRIDRKENMDVYEEGHMMYGKSPYDPLIMRLQRFNGGCWLKIEKLTLDGLHIESLSEVVSEPAVVKTQDYQPEQRVEVVIQPIRLKRRV